MSTALYRRYRPETFADVIGQEHVTDPLRAALRSDRITHAYLFSGPRGCGKTTSARIFARCLNCAEGPTDTPCGTCPSCLELARGGAGSLDVVEMDAASHGGVDDARELRERAAFAPARDRYKIFIIDEAHMVTSQGFNALLKLVEEPPAHVKFVFATTEPEKVIGTIRSRTHHYPFRLVPPERLQGYLDELCTAEGVQVESGVLPLVVRAGGGSVRDSLSVLDQLIAGAQDGSVDYERAVALLGYTHATLLDDVVDALAARDGASLFRVVDRVIDSGHDPRRFAEDLLERIRDLVVIAVSGEHASTVLRALPQDQFERMRVQSQQLGPAELSRAGDLVNDALTEMSGATSPRLQLELMCARLLLPGADDGAHGHAARLDRIERHLSAGGAAPGAGSAPEQARGAQTSPQRPAPQQGGPAPSSAPTQPEPAQRPAPSSASQRPAAPAPSATDSAQAQAAPASERPAAPAPSATPDSAPADGRAPAQEQNRPQAQDSPAAQQQTRPPAQDQAHGQDRRGERPRDGQEQTAPRDTQGAPEGDRGTSRAPQATPEEEREQAPQRQPDHPADTRPRTASSASPGGRSRAPEVAGPTQPQAASSASQQQATPGPSAPAQPAGADADLIRRRWPEVLATLARFKRSTWALVSQNAQVGEVAGGVLHLAFATSGLAHTFRSGAHIEPLQRALVETLGVQLRIEPVLSQAAEDGGGRQAAPYGAPEPTGWADVPPPPVDDAWAGASGSSAEPAAPPADDTQAPRGAAGGSTPGGAGTAQSPGPAPAAPPAADRSAGSDSPRGEVSPRLAAAQRAASLSAAETATRVAPADDTPSMDDADAENSGLVGAPLIERMLGGTVISEE